MGTAQKALCLFIILVLIYFFWIYNLQNYPSSFHEYVLFDTSALTVHQAKAQNIDPIKKFELIFKRIDKMDYIFSNISIFSLLTFIRILTITFYPFDLFMTFKVMNLILFLLFLLYIYYLLKKIFNSRIALFSIFFIVTSFPLLAVLRISGRINSLAGMFFLFTTLSYLYLFLKHLNNRYFMTFAIFASLTFVNGFHSFVMLFPLLIIFIYFLRKDFIKIGKVGILKYIMLFFTMFIFINIIMTIFFIKYFNLESSFFLNILLHKTGILCRYRPAEGCSFSLSFIISRWKSIFWQICQFFVNYMPDNHFDEYNFYHSSFTYIFSIFFAIGIFTSIKKMKKEYAIPFSLIVCILLQILVAFFSLQTFGGIYPRHMINYYIGFCIFASVGVIESYKFLKNKNKNLILVIYLLLAGHCFMTAHMFYWDYYAGYDGFAEHSYGINKAIDYIKSLEGDSIVKTPIIYGDYIHPDSLLYYTNLEKQDYYFYGYQILYEQKNYQEFREKYINNTGRIYFIFTNFKMLNEGEIGARGDGVLSLFKSRFPNQKPIKTFYYPNGEDAIYVYVDKLYGTNYSR